MMQNRKNILDKAKTELADSINRANIVYNNEELSVLLQEQQKKNEVLENTVKTLQDKVNSLDSKKLDKSFKNNSMITNKMPIGKYFNMDPNPYVIIKLGNLNFNMASMIMVNLKMYQYTNFNSMLIGGYLYVGQGYILSPSVSYLQKTHKLPVSFGIKNNDIYLIIEKGQGGYYGFYVEDISVFHAVNENIINSGWSIYSANSISDFDKVYKCQEL